MAEFPIGKSPPIGRTTPDQPDGPGYHLATIPRGEFGEVSKVIEEALELQDAMMQSCRVMALVEASDLLGALDGMLQKNFPGFNIMDLWAMTKVTQRAFENGHREPRA